MTLDTIFSVAHATAGWQNKFLPCHNFHIVTITVSNILHLLGCATLPLSTSMRPTNHHIHLLHHGNHRLPGSHWLRHSSSWVCTDPVNILTIQRPMSCWKYFPPHYEEQVNNLFGNIIILQVSILLISTIIQLSAILCFSSYCHRREDSRKLQKSPVVCP